MSEETSSNELIEMYRLGDHTAAHELFNRYVARLIGLVRRRISPGLSRRVDADDIIQSTFRSFFTAVDKGKFTFEESGDLWRLLTVMALNKLKRNVAHHNALKRCVSAESDLSAGVDPGCGFNVEQLSLLASQPLPDAAAAMAEEFELLIHDLDPIQRDMVRMRMEGYQLEEIAEAVQRSERTIRRLLERLEQRWIERASLA